MAELGKTHWFANPSVVMENSNYILVTVSWDFTEDGQTQESHLCFAFSHDPSTWERGLWQMVGSVNICRRLQTGFNDGESGVTHFSHHTVH